MSKYDHARGAFWGLALGDAMGMPTQSMSSEEILAAYGPINGLRDAIDTQPIAPGMPAGSITDDTEQALLLADELICNSGTVDPKHFAEALESWQESMIARGSLDLLGPSTNAAIAGIKEGQPLDVVGENGYTNGAAMRIAPVAIAFSGSPMLLEKVVEASYLTHNTTIGLGGAAAVAGAIAVGIHGAGVADALAAGMKLAEQAERRGHWWAGGMISTRARYFLRATSGMTPEDVREFARDVIGTSVASQESVVAALVLAQRYAEQPFKALLAAASIGGDTDTVAAICGAILGAVHGMSAWPNDAIEQIQRVNGIDIESRVEQLCELDI